MANLFGHEAGNGGHRQGKPATPPRRPPTRPGSHCYVARRPWIKRGQRSIACHFEDATNLMREGHGTRGINQTPFTECARADAISVAGTFPDHCTLRQNRHRSASDRNFPRSWCNATILY
jgi:hypothetical protein